MEQRREQEEGGWKGDGCRREAAPEDSQLAWLWGILRGNVGQAGQLQALVAGDVPPTLPDYMGRVG